MASSDSFSIGQCATLACILEASAPKPGNVNSGADFDDLTYPQLLAAAVVIGPAMEEAQSRRLGETVLEAVVATQAAVGTNANLGAILLLAPLAAVEPQLPLREGVKSVLGQLNAADVRDVYAAIRLANPGGLGSVPLADIAGPPPDDLLAAMCLAADRDLVARQYCNGFREVLADVAPALRTNLDLGHPLSSAIVHAQMNIMSRFPDSLIARKRGPAVAHEAAGLAAAVLAAAGPADDAFWTAADEFDAWLRADGHARNPGTTADLLAAGLFVLLRDGIIPVGPAVWR